ncbi:MAG: T9SS type A sorting domain-containing protein [Saprospiraceae bacterium]|nr:T9SS type A sorting domain-containing protein [Candidatus Vicinibacter affinis]
MRRDWVYAMDVVADILEMVNWWKSLFFSIKGSVAVSDPKEEFVLKVFGSKVFNQTDVLQKLKVLNLLGQTIFETEIEPRESLQLNHLSTGTYILTGDSELNKFKTLRVFIP